ncbi:hypothetical protein [Kitasatospora cineracea]|uniref:Uncharacterized protein n=1 Tax=Kitasatospora cineracea TaxID=88074 RepID=A0A3N4RM08_9ACTN|nr:hypothetical protein [Kitasatospora cineracea]RPE28000.1 hypothetical protein EDD38_7307 [Kitasatospora cineracea]
MATSALPATTKTGRHYLAKFAAAAPAVHVYRDPAKPGQGVSRPALDRLLTDGLVVLGPATDQGCPVQVTDLGHQVLAAVHS